MSEAGESGMAAALREDDTGELRLARKCRYCGVWSNAPCPWRLAGTILAAWDPDTPWARGKKGAVIGSICKICLIVA